MTLGLLIRSANASHRFLAIWRSKPDPNKIATLGSITSVVPCPSLYSPWCLAQILSIVGLLYIPVDKKCK